MATYKQIFGKQVKFLSSDPANQSEGQIWYNSTSGTFKSTLVSEAWSSGANTINSKQVPGGCGTQTAGLAAGGATAPPASALATTEEYNGLGWTAGGNVNTARWSTKLIGTQTAAVYSGKGTPATPYTGATELYNGTVWTANPNSANDTYNYRSGCGISTAALLSGGNYPPTNRAAGNENFDGTSFSEGGDLPQKQSSNGQAGTQTAAINSFGSTNSPVPGNTGDANNAISLEYNGTAWTAGPDGNGVVFLSGFAMGAGTQTDALFAGPSTSSVKYDGTTFTVGPALATAQPGSAQSSGPAGAGWVAHGDPVPSVGSKTQEFNRTASVITAAAWASGTAMTNAREMGAGCGPATAAMATGGQGAPPTFTILALTEQYDGTSWTETGDLNSARKEMASATSGSQTAALIFGGKTSPPAAGTNVTEEFNGASWTTTLNSMNTARTALGGCGTSIAALGYAGFSPPLQNPTASEEWNGTSWTEGPNVNTGRGNIGSCGTQTAGLGTCGYIDGGGGLTVLTEEYNGASWAVAGANLTATHASSAAGTQADAINFGGTTNLATTTGYDGTAWSTRPSLGTGKDYTCTGTGSATAGLCMGGGPAVTTVEAFTGEASAVNYKTITTS